MTADDWVPVFDASGSWPDDPAAVWAAGYRVISGYVNQGSWKSFTPAMRDKWITAAHPFGFAPLWEAVGDEPMNNPNTGTAHAHSARAGLRALFDDSDHVSIGYAMDRNTSPGNANVRHYYSLVLAADTAAPIGYIESDAGLPLVAAHILAGVFEPAAYSWDNRTSVMTPASAPAGVLWTQEHNGVKISGSGSVDIGHIRTTAPILWPATEGDDDMAELVPADVTKAVWGLTANAGDSEWDVIPNTSVNVADSPNHDPAGDNANTSAGYAVGRTRQLAEDNAVAVAEILAAVRALANPATIAAAVVAALPKGEGAPITVDDITAAVHSAVSGLTLSGTLTAA